MGFDSLQLYWLSKLLNEKSGMGIFHYLNVKQGDCSLIQHPSGHVTVVDVCNAAKEDELAVVLKRALAEAAGVSGNFNQKEYPVNPVTYLKSFGIKEVFRFILTHPEMDHMDGIADFFEIFKPANFWDSDNMCEKEFTKGCHYNEEDWVFYKSLRDSNPVTKPKRLALLAGAKGQYYNQAEDGSGGGDGLYILAPTKDLIDEANETDNYNDASYVILYRSAGGRVLLTGDSHDKTWEHILKNHEDDVKDVDLLIAPHHGRKSNRSYEFLDTVNPALTFFGNANSEHLAYGAWNYRNLPYITNNQANCMVVNTDVSPMKVYVTNKGFAEKYHSLTSHYSSEFKGYYIGQIKR